MPANTSAIIDYFRAKRDVLLAESRQAVADHGGLRGTHRELVVDRYLRDVLPGRFAIGTGEIHGEHHRSRQTDLVLWEEANFPKMNLNGSTIFFAESVRAAIEVKSRWSEEELSDILIKSRSVRDIVLTSDRPNLDDELAMVWSNLAHLRGAPEPVGMMRIPHHIGTGALVVRGGAQFTLAEVSGELRRDTDDAWPDVLLLLEPGIVVVKEFEHRDGFMGGVGWLERYTLGEDALLFFTHALLHRLVVRSVHVETPLDLSRYAASVVRSAAVERLQFALSRPAPSRVPLFTR